MGRKPKRKIRASSPLVLFSLETINLTIETVKRFAQSLERVTGQDEKTTFAREQLKHVEAKLQTMRTEAEAGHMRFALLDYNEKVALVAAIQIYAFNLTMQPASARRAWELEQCRRIAAYFAPNRSNEQKEGENVL